MGSSSSRNNDTFCFCFSSKTRNYTKKDKYIEEECVICCDNNNNYKKIKLNCSHIFHKRCIETWWQYKYDCPICREGAVTSIL